MSVLFLIVIVCCFSPSLMLMVKEETRLIGWREISEPFIQNIVDLHQYGYYCVDISDHGDLLHYHC